MTVEVIRVEDSRDKDNAAVSAFKYVKDRSHRGLFVAAPIVVFAAPFIATTAVTLSVATIVGAGAAAAGEKLRGPVSRPDYTSLSPDEAEGMVDAHDQPMMRDVTYFRHPKASEKAIVIRSSDFHSYIMSEKIAEIIDYLRAETRLKSLSILIRSSDSKHAVVGGKLEGIPAKLRADLTKQHERRMALNYDEPSRANGRKNYLWIDDFPEVIAATRNARKGTFSFSQSTDMSFGMSGKFAKAFNLDAGWLNTFVIEVEAAFA